MLLILKRLYSRAFLCISLNFSSSRGKVCEHHGTMHHKDIVQWETCQRNLDHEKLPRISDLRCHNKLFNMSEIILTSSLKGWILNWYLPAASACLDIVWNDVGFVQLGLDMVAVVADLNRVTIGLSPPSWECNICPSAPGINPNQGAVCINWRVSTSLC